MTLTFKNRSVRDLTARLLADPLPLALTAGMIWGFLGRLILFSALAVAAFGQSFEAAAAPPLFTLESSKSTALATFDVDGNLRIIRQESRASIRLHRWSMIAMAAGASADIASSIHFAKDGQRESNSLLAPNGRFGARGAAIEGGAIAANLLVQYLVVKRFPSTRKLFTVVNFGYAGVQAFNVRHNVNY